MAVCRRHKFSKNRYIAWISLLKGILVSEKTLFQTGLKPILNLFTSSLITAFMIRGRSFPFQWYNFRSAWKLPINGADANDNNY